MVNDLQLVKNKSKKIKALIRFELLKCVYVSIAVYKKSGHVFNLSARRPEMCYFLIHFKCLGNYSMNNSRRFMSL